MWLFVVLAIFGLVVGGLVRLLIPGPEAIGVLGTILAGIAGSIIGGFVGLPLFGDTNWLGSLALAVAGAVLLVLPFRVPGEWPGRGRPRQGRRPRSGPSRT